MLGVAAGAAAISTRAALGQDEGTPESTPTIQNISVGEMPSTGALRPGPIGQQPPVPPSAATLPVAIIVQSAGIDAEIETLNIVDGRLENPTGPWVVAWYQQSAELGFVQHFWGLHHGLLPVGRTVIPTDTERT